MAKKKHCYSGIGGQAVLEGIMMRNGDKSAVAVRKSDGTIDVQTIEYKGAIPKNFFTTLPFIRGVVNFIDSLMLGIKGLNFSADITMDEEDMEPGKFEKWIKKHFGDKANDILLSITMIIAVVMSVGLFMVLPYALSALMGIWVHNKLVLSIAEAVMRFMIFIGYVVLIGQLEDIKRLYMYHGAEHKCIDCIEKGRILTVNDVMRSNRLHPRCGTSFMLYVMAISCILFFFINVENPLQRLGLRLLLIPVIAGISYELIRLAGRFDNPITRLLSLPGMALQKLTTKEPTRDMVEVAIKAVEAVYDWKAFLSENYGYEVQDAWLREEDTEEEYGEDEVESFVEKLEDAFEDIEDKFEDIFEDLEERFEDALENIEDHLEDAVDKVKDTAERILKQDEE
jgi:uncharacterized protein YqhQ